MTLISTLLTKLAAALASLAAVLGISLSPVAVSTSPAIATTSVPTNTVLSNSSLSVSGGFIDKNWSLIFTIPKEWNINEILAADYTLHQLQISGTKQVVFISKNEGIGLSEDLESVTKTRTIAGQSVEVRTYPNPDTTFAYYQTFSLKEPDGTYNFLLKSTTADMAATDAFIKSIANK